MLVIFLLYVTYAFSRSATTLGYALECCFIAAPPWGGGGAGLRRGDVTRHRES